MSRLSLLFFLVTPFLGIAQTFETSNLPIIIIDTQGNTIINEPKVSATMGIVDNGPGNENSVNDPYNDYNGNIGIEYRGSSSQFLFDKKGFGIELWKGFEEDTAFSLLGMPAESDWVLHGPYSDKTLMRNALTFHLWSKTGRYGSRTRFVELVLNDDYHGVYVLMEKIKRDKNRVAISKLKEDENSGDDVTGGYIIKLDKLDGSNSGQGWDSGIEPPNRAGNQTVFFQYDYPKAKNISSEQQAYIKGEIDDFESRLISDQFAEPGVGYREVIDAGSFIDFAIINEVTRNVDGYRLSTFLYKDKDSEDGKIYIGPIWDFNLAFGNADYCDGSNIEGWAWDFNNICNGDHWLIPFWWDRLLQDPSYAAQFVDRWNELRTGPLATSSIHQYIDSLSNSMDAAQKRNFQRWPIQGQYIWPNNFVGFTYQQDVDYLKDWIEDRMKWLDVNISALAVVTGIESEELKRVKTYPNPVIDHLTITGMNNVELVEIHDTTGRILLSHQNHQTLSTVDINLQDFPKGILILRLTDSDGNSMSSRILK